MIFKLSEFCYLNPREKLAKGEIATKIAMEDIPPFSRDVPVDRKEAFNGGTKFKNGDTIMARITPCLENGKTAQVRHLKENEVAFGSTEYIVFRSKPNISDADFLYYLVKSTLVRDPSIKSMVGSSGRQRVQMDVVARLQLDLPDLPTQRKIAHVLSTIDDKIELNNKINDNLLQQAFTLFDSQFSDITAGSCLISDYILPKRGRGLLSKDAIKGDVPVVAGGLEPATYHNVANTTSPVLTISASGANAGFIRLWNIPVWSSDSSFIDSSISEFVYFWFVLLKKRQDEIYGSQTGSAQPHIYPQNIGELPICELDKNEVKRYNDLVTPLFEKIGANELENKSLAKLRDTLLPKLMSGEIDVDSIEL